jgi:hypothetical protein
MGTLHPFTAFTDRKHHFASDIQIYTPESQQMPMSQNWLVKPVNL